MVTRHSTGRACGTCTALEWTPANRDIFAALLACGADADIVHHDSEATTVREWCRKNDVPDIDAFKLDYRRDIVLAMTRDVEVVSGERCRVLPLPVDGGHVLLFCIVAEYVL